MEIRVNKVMIELNIGFDTVVSFLRSVPGLEPDRELTPNTKLSDAQYEALRKRFGKDAFVRAKARTLVHNKRERLTGKNEKTKSADNQLSIESYSFREKVKLHELVFENHKLFYQIGEVVYVLVNGNSPAYVKSNVYLRKMNSEETYLVLNRKNLSFVFQDINMLNQLNTLSAQVEKEKKDKENRIREQQRKETKETNKEPVSSPTSPITKHRTSFSNLQIGEGVVTLKYKKKIYIYKDKKINNLNRILSLYYKSLSKKQISRFKASVIKVAIHEDNHSFEFVDFDLYEFVMDKIKGSYKSASFIPVVQKEQELPQVSTIMTTKLDIDNIEFFDGYYIVALTKEKNKDKSIASLKVNDSHSFACLRHVHRYFSDRFPQNITIKYNDKKITGLKPAYVLSQYVRTLYGNMNEHGEWWEEVQNERKPSLSTCRTTSAAVVKKKVSLRSGYLDNLASMQNEKKLIPVYEINHGNQEDAFIFTIAMSANRCAIIFENVSADASTATEVFIAKDENYESCINLIFDYFTDYAISTKRDSLRRGVNSPSKFKAENFYSVAHGELGTWLVKMNQILEHTPLPSKIEFESGLHVPRDIVTRSGNSRITPKNIHNELMRQLYSQLCKEYGADYVGTEIRIGSKRIDAVVKAFDCYDIYEIKSDPDPFSCVTLALGQICQYAYLYCRDRIGKMVIVGATTASPEVEHYLSWFRKKHSMEVYYLHIPI